MAINLLTFFNRKAREQERINVVEPRVQYERTYEVSPIFSFQNENDILANKDIVIDFASSKKATQKYLPFNTMQIINNSASSIIVYINQRRDKPLLIPNGTIFPINPSIAPAISSVVIKNNSTTATISVNEIQLLVSKDNVTTDLLAKKLHKLLLKGGL